MSILNHGKHVHITTVSTSPLKNRRISEKEITVRSVVIQRTSEVTGNSGYVYYTGMADKHMVPTFQFAEIFTT